MRKPTVQIAPWVFPLTEETASVPRMCWEKLSAVFTSCINLGSPPRVRGKDAVCTVGDAGCRITPACAGKRAIQGARAAGTEDHPRVCGEKAVLPMWTNTRLGSPPRVRGKAFSYSARSRAVGITPACAGKRPPDFPSRPPAGDHPRVCGEKLIDGISKFTEKGSPPRVRGKD